MVVVLLILHHYNARPPFLYCLPSSSVMGTHFKVHDIQYDYGIIHDVSNFVHWENAPEMKPFIQLSIAINMPAL